MSEALSKTDRLNASVITEKFIDAARRSDQATFEPTSELADDDGLVFVTHVPDAPCQVYGRLSRNGRWYCAGTLVAPLSGAPAIEEVTDQLDASVIRLTGPLAERMIYYGIEQVLCGPYGSEAARKALKVRLSSSRFRAAAP